MDKIVIYKKEPINAALRCVKPGEKVVLTEMHVVRLFDEKSSAWKNLLRFIEGEGFWIDEKTFGLAVGQGNTASSICVLCLFEAKKDSTGSKFIKEKGSKFFERNPELLMEFLEKMGVDMTLADKENTGFKKSSSDIWPKGGDRDLLVITRK